MSYPDAKYPSEKVTTQDMPERVDGVDTILAEHINKLQQEVIAIQQELGVLPKGDAADVATRIGAHLDNTAPHSATAAATANRLVLRDSNGRAQIATPSVANDIATKGYVDGAVGSIVVPTLKAIIEDRKSSGSGGGEFTSGAWRTRVLNSLVYNAGGISLSNNRFTITPSGTQKFLIRWSAPAVGAGTAVQLNHQSLLYRYSPSATNVAYGVTAGIRAAAPHINHSFGSAVVTLSAAATYEIRHRVSDDTTFGSAAGFGTEVYTRVEIYLIS